MKRVISRFTILLILAAAGFLIYNESPVKAASCWETAYSKWTACDNGYSNTTYQQATVNSYCLNNTASICAADADSFCASQANANCTNNSNPNQCYNNNYNSCYSSRYQSCHTETELQCRSNINDAYNNRNNTYSSCLGFEGNGNNCIEQIADSCQQARDRASSCNSVYNGSEDSDALSICLENSGVSQCQ